MRVLAIDTATLYAGVALVDGEGGRFRVLGTRSARVSTHSEALLPLIRELLDGTGVALAGLAAIACGAGPGSFTGLRIGMATAKGLCLAAERPLIVVSSLQALAARAAPGALAVACLDAFKGEVYAGFYEAGDPPRAIAEEIVAPPEAVAARIIGHLAEGRRVAVIGDGPARWPALRVSGAIVDDAAPPDPCDLGRLALHRAARGDFDDLASAAPRYIRPSEAEANLERAR